MKYTGDRVEKTYQYLSKHSNWLKDEEYDRDVIASLISFIVIQHLQKWEDLVDNEQKNNRRHYRNYRSN